MTSETVEADTRTAIIESAKHCFAEYGYRGTSNKRIAAHAGVTTALIYYYFESKAKLFSAVFEYITQQRYERVETALSPDATLVQEVSALTDDLISLWHRDPAFVRLFAMLPIEVRHNPELITALEPEREQLGHVWGRLVAAAQASGDLPEGTDPGAMGQMFVVWFTGLMACLSTQNEDQIRGAANGFVAILAAFHQSPSGSTSKRR